MPLNDPHSPHPSIRVVPSDVPVTADSAGEWFEPSPQALARGPETITLNHGSTFLVAAPDSALHPEHEHGLYSDDTRYLSRHELRLNGRPLRSLATARLSFRRARWTLAPTRLVSLDGRPAESRVTVTVDRAVGERRLHEDLVVRCHGREPVELLLTLALDSDFADLFEVRTERWQRRTGVGTMWAPADRRLETRYRRERFIRRCLVRFEPSSVAVSYASGQLRFPIDLSPGGEWRTCVHYDLVPADGLRPRQGPCPITSGAEDRAGRLHRRWHRTAARSMPADPRLRAAFVQAIDDFAALRLYDHDFSPDVWLPAAGVPWFVAVFGRDSILASLQALPIHPLFAIGTLQKLAQWQARDDDPVRDAEPGKICHEMRVGEWANFRTIPHSPYYGTAEATPLYLLLLGQTYAWLGDLDLLQPFRGAAERCLEWIDTHGDLDGDGLQEWAPRSPAGYRNQNWRDAEDGVLDEQGGFPPHPIGTCDLDAYVYAAKRAVAPLFAAWGDRDRAERLESEAADLRRRYLDAFWLEDEGALGFARDGDKRLLRTATSLPGHCLWLGILDRACAERVADRLMQPDLFAGWGLRTLSNLHPAYDPHSYQRGSVWPHDTMIAAAGLARYGRIEDAWRLMDGLLAAVSAFDRAQMPELFAGLQRVDLDAPIPYERANVPQAWAAGSVFHAVRTLLGLEPDVPGGTVYVDPALPPWCPALLLENVRIGAQRFAFHAVRDRDGVCAIDVDSGAGHLDVVRGRPPRLALPGDGGSTSQF
jgi:glycogen debranching enzyme